MYRHAVMKQVSLLTVTSGEILLLCGQANLSHVRLSKFQAGDCM